MKIQPAQRAVILGQYIIENRATVRTTARKFGISKSTVHMDVQKENVLKCLNTAFLPSSALRQRTVILS
ncbi:MAG: sporulation transcriptional regulator SpoIIID [Ruminococcus flavefaciens]|nr:sporulation transcriptional regulator SpoIIID [Ruminococcus flavefaciens]